MQNWTELSRKTVFNKYSRKIDQVNFQLPDGQIADYYLKKESPAVATLAITKDQKVILARQFRPGPNKILNELPGGGINLHQETIEAGSLRELQEETGYSGKATLVGKVYDCAYSTMERYCVVVTDCQKISDQDLDNTEFIEVVLMNLKEFRDLIRSGEMTDIEIAYLGLDYLGLL